MLCCVYFVAQVSLSKIPSEWNGSVSRSLSMETPESTRKQTSAGRLITLSLKLTLLTSQQAFMSRLFSFPLDIQIHHVMFAFIKNHVYSTSALRLQFRLKQDANAHQVEAFLFAVVTNASLFCVNCSLTHLDIRSKFDSIRRNL